MHPPFRLFQTTPYGRATFTRFLSLSWQASCKDSLSFSLVSLAFLGMLVTLSIIFMGQSNPWSVLTVGTILAFGGWWACRVVRPALWRKMLTTTPTSMADAQGQIAQVVAQAAEEIQALVIFTHGAPPFALALTQHLPNPPDYTHHTPFPGTHFHCPDHVRAWVRAEIEGYPWAEVLHAQLGKKNTCMALLLLRTQMDTVTTSIPPLSAHRVLALRTQPPRRRARSLVYRCVQACGLGGA